jgi:hypothetical protein
MDQVDVGRFMEPFIDDSLPPLKAPTVVRYATMQEVSGSVDRTRRGTGNALRRAYPVPGAASEDMRCLLRQLDEQSVVLLLTERFDFTHDRI